MTCGPMSSAPWASPPSPSPVCPTSVRGTSIRTTTSWMTLSWCCRRNSYMLSLPNSPPTLPPACVCSDCRTNLTNALPSFILMPNSHSHTPFLILVLPKQRPVTSWSVHTVYYELLVTLLLGNAISLWGRVSLHMKLSYPCTHTQNVLYTCSLIPMQATWSKQCSLIWVHGNKTGCFNDNCTTKPKSRLSSLIEQ